jgi:hypothetical protein
VDGKGTPVAGRAKRFASAELAIRLTPEMRGAFIAADTINGGFMPNRLNRSGAALDGFAILLMAAGLYIGGGRALAQTTGATLASWDSVATVLQHPRCMNCHQDTVPLQGDSRRQHIPLVVRGKDNHGVSAMRCANCHNEVNNQTSGTPGAPHWQLSPVTMRWQGLSSGEMCRQLTDPKRNGNRNGEALIKHMEADALVLWGWNPGGTREPVSIPHAEFVQHLKTWVAGGMACPK